jgi:predicted dehydrogenase
MPERIRIGFLGAGQWGRAKHLPAITHIQRHCTDRFNVEIAALCERDADIATHVSREYGIPIVYHDMESFAADETLDCYAIVVDPRGLLSVIETLRRRRVPILTEKPPGFRYEEAQYLAHTIDVPNVVAFNRRYFPIVETFRKLLSEVQGIYYVDCNFYRHERYDSKQFSEGTYPDAVPFVIGTGLHAINLLEDLFGEIISSRTTELRVETNDTRAWLCDLDFRSGVKGRLKMLPCSGSATEWIEVHSQRRSLYLHYGMYGETDYPGRIYVHQGGNLEDVIEGDGQAPRIVNEGFVGEYLDLFQAVVNGGPTRSNFRNALNSMRIAAEVEYDQRAANTR